jgi:predicted Rossmann fold nucleotide-binding protein DprA/Smf involved in DNA uptake
MSARPPLRNLGEVLRDEMVEKDAIAALLKGGPRTIPEIAAELRAPPAEVTKWLMAMRRYGRVRDLPKSRSDDYYRYALVEGGP